METNFSMITTSKTCILWKCAIDTKLYRIYMVMRMQTRCTKISYQPMKKAAEVSVPVKAKVKQHVPWENENIIEKREIVKKAHEECLRRNTRSSVAKLEEAKQDLQESYDQEQREVCE